MSRAWLYCRIAPPDAGDALEHQKGDLIRFAQERRYEIAGVTAKYENGLSLDREGLAEIKTAIRNQRVDVLVVRNPARIGRGAWDVSNFIHWLDAQGVSLICTDDAGTESASYLEQVTGYITFISSLMKSVRNAKKNSGA